MQGESGVTRSRLVRIEFTLMEEEGGKDDPSGFDLSDGQYEDFHDQSITIEIQETVGNVRRGKG